MVLANQGYNLSTRWWRLSNIPGLKIIPLQADIPPVEFGVAYRMNARRDLIDAFLSCVKEVPFEGLDEQFDL